MNASHHDWPDDLRFEDDSMWDWDREPRHMRRHRRHDEEEDFAVDDVDRELMTPEERVLADARRHAEQKVRLTNDLVKYGAITLILLIFVPPVGVGLGIPNLAPKRLYLVLNLCPDFSLLPGHGSGKECLQESEKIGDGGKPVTAPFLVGLDRSNLLL